MKRKANERPSLDDLNSRLRAIAHDLGYAPGLDPEAHEKREGTAWWFYRHGTAFTTEALSFRVVWFPRAEIETHFFGSLLTPIELSTLGLSGNAVGFNLFLFQFCRLNLPAAELLPQGVEIGDRSQVDGVFERLRDEIRRADAHVWPSLHEAWLKSRNG
jgi:hypothetical protein